jgi:hypothetical protein
LTSQSSSFMRFAEASTAGTSQKRSQPQASSSSVGLAEAPSESLAVLGLLAAIPSNPLAATALAELLSRRRSCERITEVTSRDSAELGQSWERGEAKLKLMLRSSRAWHT